MYRTHRQAVLEYMPGCRSRRDGSYAWYIVDPRGNVIASGGSAQQAWYLARIHLMNNQQNSNHPE